MKSKLIYLLVLIVLLVLWGVSKPVAHSLQREALNRSNALSAGGTVSKTGTLTNPPLIPVTGDTQPGWVLLIYGLIGLLTLVLILALLNVANKSTTLSVKRKVLTDETNKSSG